VNLEIQMDADVEVLKDLEQLGTLPEYQGKGCGSRLMKWALDQADAERAEAYLEASAEGMSLYRKFGFREVDAVKSMVEGSGEYENLCMIREPKGKV
jgi:GNAT superfamily N-acetyltransferase